MRPLFTLLLTMLLASAARAGEPAAEVGKVAPPLSLRDQNDRPFTLDSRRGKWTVLYFYPKDDTPGCTRQACAFRDSIEVIRKLDAEVYGVSQDSSESHRKFIAKHKLTFPLLADSEGRAAKAYGTDGMMGFSKRWTFVIGPDLTIRWLQKNVDPALNAREVAGVIEKLKASK